MGEYAEMMLDGTLCECCGTFIGEGSGFPGYCSAQCAKDRGAGDATSDEDCIAYLNDLEGEERDNAAHYLRIFMGVGKKRAKRLVAQWRARLAPSPSSGGESMSEDHTRLPPTRGEGQGQPTIVVLFSCGAASAVAIQETHRRYGLTHRIRVVNNPVAEEGEDNRRFLRDVERWLDIKVEIVTNPKYPNASAEEVWDRRGAMSFPKGAPCTFHLKREARQIWEAANPTDFLVLGFGAEEKDRHETFVLTERSNVLPVLIEAGLTRQDCFEIIVSAGIEPPAAYALGYPNANCRGCVKATSPTYWNHVRRVDPEVFDRRAEQSRRLGVKLARVNNERVFLDELDPDAKGRPLKSLKMPECGLFCEEKLPRQRRAA